VEAEGPRPRPRARNGQGPELHRPWACGWSPVAAYNAIIGYAVCHICHMVVDDWWLMTYATCVVVLSRRDGVCWPWPCPLPSASALLASCLVLHLRVGRDRRDA
jgi:hypothetical protein